MSEGKGRPIKLTPALQDKIVQYVKAGNYIETAAAACGISKNTLYDWMKRGARYRRGENQQGKDPLEEAIFADFSDALEKAFAEAEVVDVLTIGKAAKENWQAAAWRLERKNFAKWGRKDKHEVTGANGGPIEHEHTHSAKDELLSKLTRLIAAEQEDEDTGSTDD